MNLLSLAYMINSNIIFIIHDLLLNDLCSLALQVLLTLQSEHPYQSDLNVYAVITFSSSNNKLFDNIDHLIDDLKEGEGWVKWGSDKGLLWMIGGVVEARRKESIFKVYGMNYEYMVKVLRKGLKRMAR
ncbi:hypothetical protein NC653_002057 [Populus alba x Populus x berolinensis]|uniref:Uncharacterized protein n=2 Tax=Populus TaxID=3689 RepID=A0A4U5M9E1_POPAL|nr:hypothetical protein NC653_002057 [Populus alba x Populus x berolinensis]TKR65606.1 hypothetical protein D5086_0000319390 [Populus alba]